MNKFGLWFSTISLILATSGAGCGTRAGNPTGGAQKFIVKLKIEDDTFIKSACFTHARLYVQDNFDVAHIDVPIPNPVELDFRRPNQFDIIELLPDSEEVQIGAGIALTASDGCNTGQSVRIENRNGIFAGKKAMQFQFRGGDANGKFKFGGGHYDVSLKLTEIDTVGAAGVNDKNDMQVQIESSEGLAQEEESSNPHD